jgi:lysozyme
MRSINPAGIALIESHEGLRLKAYLDTGNVPTIGYGHTHNVKMGDTCSNAMAAQWLGEDLAAAENAVEHLVTVPLNDNEFSALVAFNIGFGNFAKSTLLKRLNDHAYSAVPTYMRAWVFDAGKKQPGLVARRDAEAALWSMK